MCHNNWHIHMSINLMKLVKSVKTINKDCTIFRFKVLTYITEVATLQ